MYQHPLNSNSLYIFKSRHPGTPSSNHNCLINFYWENLLHLFHRPHLEPTEKKYFFLSTHRSHGTHTLTFLFPSPPPSVVTTMNSMDFPQSSTAPSQCSSTDLALITTLSKLLSDNPHYFFSLFLFFQITELTSILYPSLLRMHL